MDINAMDFLTGVKTPITPQKRFSTPLKKATAMAVTQTNTPQFPGSRSGDKIEEVRNWIKKQKRAKGYRFPIQNGQDNLQQLQLSGTARIFLGFSLFIEDTTAAVIPTETFFTINNEIIIDGVAPIFFSPDFMDDEYYFFPRPLNGMDNITMNFTGVAGNVVYAVMYYI